MKNSESKFKKKKKYFVKGLKLSIKTIYNSSKYLIIGYVVCYAVLRLLPLANIYLLNILLDKLFILNSEDKVLNEVISIAIIYVLSLMALKIINSLTEIIRNIISQKAAHEYDQNILLKLNDMPISYIDTSTGKDNIEEARYAGDMVIRYFFRIIISIVSLYALIIALIPLIQFNIYFTIIFFVLTVPAVYFSLKIEKNMWDFRKGKRADIRKMSYYRWMLTDPWPAKDIRMYDLTENIKKRYNEEKDKYIKHNTKHLLSNLKIGLIGGIFRRIGELIFLAFVIIQTFKGNISIGKMTLLIGYSEIIINQIYAIFTTGIIYYKLELDELEKVFDFLDYETKEYKGESLKNIETIVFNNVSFTYPYTNNPILDNVSFTINKGDKLSIVGINGAGKTTIIKLILGLYQVNSGEILINGKNINDYDLRSLWRICSAVFQKFVQYPLTVRENIAMSDLERLDNNEEIIASLIESDIYNKLQTKEDFLDTHMTRRFSDEGIELSKGEWQKIALSRAYFKKHELIILDEPSASLDAVSEDKIFQNFHNISAYKTAIFISHRVSTSKLATNIIVLDNGKIAESGSHEELMNLNGKYADLYSLQAKKYQGENIQNE